MVQYNDVVPRPGLGWAWPTGRVLMALLFLVSGLLKFAFALAIAGAIASKGLPGGLPLAYAIGAFEVIAAGLLIAGVRVFEVALALAAWSLLTALTFHQFWAATGMEQQNQMANFLKNIALVGGLLVIAYEAPSRAVPIAKDAI